MTTPRTSPPPTKGRGPGAVAYTAIGRHGVIGDRRTAALVAADGTLDWSCWPDYDGDVLFGSLLDARSGGLWRLGPARLVQGQQAYEPDAAALVTAWALDGARLELTDVMPWPEDARRPERERHRAVVRRLRCAAGEVACALIFQPRAGASHDVRLWTSRDLALEGGVCRFTLRAGDEVWASLCGGGAELSSIEACREALDETLGYWRGFVARLDTDGLRHAQAARAAITIHLLAYAPAGSSVAAPTTSLPERIGGSWNADYRFAWIRDASLSMGALATLGHLESAARYLDWLPNRAHGEALRQPVFTIRGADGTPQREDSTLSGYRGSRPVRFGNDAYEQRQLGSLGFLADCAWLYVSRGGAWNERHWSMIEEAAEHTASHWREADNSLWELSHRAHYVTSRVMSWVALDRAVCITRHTKRAAPFERWRQAMREIHAEVLAEGWSEELGAFRQRYGADNLDAAALLIPLMGFLPFDDPRVVRTIDRIAEELTIDDFVYRFRPDEVPGVGDQAFAELEAAFLPCTLWLAAAYAGLGRRDRAERIVARVDAVAGPTGLLAEAVDPRDGVFRGNAPLVFSHVAYLRALHALAPH